MSVGTEVVQIGNRVYRILFPDLVDPLTNEEYTELRDDMREDGIRVPIVLDEDRGVIDGIHRIRIAKELGIEDIPEFIVRNRTLEQKIDWAWSVNHIRRHWGPEQKRLSRQEQIARRQARLPRVAAMLDEGLSERTIAAAEGVSRAAIQRDIRQIEEAESNSQNQPRSMAGGVIVPPELNGVFPTAPVSEDQPPTLYDGLNVAVPYQLREAFKARALITEACSKIREAQKAHTAACRSKAGDLIRLDFTAVDRELNNMAVTLARNKPYAVCPLCDGQARSGCAACKGRGWIIKATLNQLPRDE